MTNPSLSPTAVRWAVSTLDHLAAQAGYAAVPEASPSGGGWRRLYLRQGDLPTLSAVGPQDGGWVSLGVEIPCHRRLLEQRGGDLLHALAPYEVALDPDAGADRHGPEAVLRIALRLFVEGLHGSVLKDAVGNLSEAAAEARRVLGA